jgi:hypothetical protein
MRTGRIRSPDESRTVGFAAMPTEETNQPLSAADLEALSTPELRERAFAAAEHHHDAGFFWDLVKHLRASESIGSDDGSAGGLGESISGAINLVTELLGKHEGSLEPLLRARYIDYLSKG